MRLEWGETNARDVESITDLDVALDTLAVEMRAEPAMVELFAADSSSLSIGLGRPWSVISYIGPTGDPPYFHSVAVDPVTEEDPVVFLFRGQYSDFPPQSCVLTDVAREAARLFFRTGKRPTNVTWEED